MTERPNILLLGAAPERQEHIRAKLGASYNVRSESLAQAILLANRLDARLAIVDFSGDLDARVGAMEELTRSAPQLHVVALAARKDPDLILRAMRAGAREFVVLDDSEELNNVVAKLVRQTIGRQGGGSILSVFPAKGGAGATFIATNLAGLLAQAGKSVVLVDLDLEMGDVLVTLDLAGKSPISEVLQNMHRLDGDLVRSSLAQHGSGVYVLSQSDHLQEVDRVTAPQVGTLLTFLARHYDYVVIDGMRGFGELSIAALDCSDQVLLVTAQTVPALKNAQRCLDLYRRLRYPDVKIKVVVNRYLKSDSIDLASMSDTLGVAIAGLVGNDYATVIGAINRGLLVQDAAPKSRVAQDLRALAGTFGAKGAETKSRGFLKGLFGSREEEPQRKETPDGLKRAPEAV